MRIRVNFVTSSAFKREENEAFTRVGRLKDGMPVSDVFRFDLVENTITETLEVDLGAMVTSEVKAAYSQLRRPCIVEHAGLIFSDYEGSNYPGGLTKPMWNTLGDDFLEETHSKGRSVIARAVIGYCDGMRTWTFAGSTRPPL